MAFRESLFLSVAQLKARLREKPCGAFAFYGPEELLKHFYLDKFRALIEKEGAAEFNAVNLDFSRDHTMDDVISEGEILPFMGEKRLVVVRGAAPSQWSEKDQKKLLEFLENFPEYLILIFYLEENAFSGDKKTWEKKGIQNLAGKMNFVNFPLQEEKVLLPWAKKILSSDGVEAPDGALRLLFRLSGNRMNRIRSQLEQLALYAVSQKKTFLSEEDILRFAPDTTEFAVYQLSDAVLDGATSAVVRILSGLKKQAVEPILLVGALSRQIASALLCVEGADAAMLSKIAKVQPWQYEKLRRTCRNLSAEALNQAFLLCTDLDRRLKGERSDAFLMTEIIFLQITELLGGKK